jgi:hypothetical protein
MALHAPPVVPFPGVPKDAKLYIVKQHSLTQESTPSGKIIRVVVKNSPFVVLVGCEPPIVDLKHFHYDTALCYDTATLKEVDFINNRPLETKISVTENGSQLACEARLKVLTSQLEDMTFKLRIRAVDPKTKAFTGLQVLSESIKVVSKPEQARKKKKNSEGGATAASPPTAPVSSISSPIIAPAPVPSRKRSSAGSHAAEESRLLPVLERLHRQAAHNHDLLNDLRRTDASVSDSTPGADGAVTDLLDGCPEGRTIADFETSFTMLMQGCGSVSVTDRTERVRRVARALGFTADSVAEMRDLFWAEGLGRALGEPESQFPSTSSGVPVSENDAETACGPDCPAKKELERVEHFYREVFSLQ